jgi:hypothetical protein
MPCPYVGKGFGVGLFGWGATTLIGVEMRRVGCEVSEVSSLTSQRPQLFGGGEMGAITVIADRRLDFVGGCL